MTVTMALREKTDSVINKLLSQVIKKKIDFVKFMKSGTKLAKNSIFRNLQENLLSNILLLWMFTSFKKHFKLYLHTNWCKMVQLA